MLTKKEDFMSNKELVLKFYDEVFNGWNVDAIKNYIHEELCPT